MSDFGGHSGSRYCCQIRKQLLLELKRSYSGMELYSLCLKAEEHSAQSMCNSFVCRAFWVCFVSVCLVFLQNYHQSHFASAYFL